MSDATVAATASRTAVAAEARSGLLPWKTADLPAPPATRGTGLLALIGPGAIVLGLSIGSGEWLIGPAAFVKYGLSLLWVTTAAVFLQTVLNTELMRYTLYTGEPAVTGFMRTRPRSTFWAWFYAGLFFLQVGWPAWAANAAGALFFLFLGQLPLAGDASTVYWIGVGTFLICVVALLFGRKIERTLEILNWILIICILGGMLILCLIFFVPRLWLAALVGFAGFDLNAGQFQFIPPDADWFLIGAFAGYSGAGGVSNLMLSNWARDKGFGMSQVVGYIPGAVGGQHVKLAHTGSVFPITAENMKNWRAWWRVVQIDQWCIFWAGAMIGMALPAILYSIFIMPGRDIRDLAIAAELASAILARSGPILAAMVGLMSAWVLLKTQLDQVEGMSRALTDILWAGRKRSHAEGAVHKDVDVRWVYYGVLATMVIWGVIALRLTRPIILLQLAANVAGVAMVISAIHILYLNTKFLPKEIQPPLWRRVSLVAMALFYGFFVYLWLMGGFIPDPDRGFLFNLPRFLGITGGTSS